MPPMITSLLAYDWRDVDGLDQLVEHIFAGQLTGLFILGTTGEGPSLSYRVRRELITRMSKSLKCALDWLGICSELLAPPLQSFGDAVRKLIGRRLAELAVLPNARASLARQNARRSPVCR